MLDPTLSLPSVGGSTRVQIPGLNFQRQQHHALDVLGQSTQPWSGPVLEGLRYLL